MQSVSPLGYHCCGPSRPMPFFKRKLNSSDIGLLLVGALMKNIEHQQVQDLQMMTEWFGENAPQHQNVYNELQYLRAVAVDFAIRSCFDKELKQPVLNEFRKHFCQTGNELAAQSEEVLPFYHFYLDRLARYEKAMSTVSDPRSFVANTGGLFTQQCGLPDNLLIASRASIEFIGVKVYIVALVDDWKKSYTFVSTLAGKYCGECGAPIEPTWKVCPHCGTKSWMADDAGQ